MVTLEDGKTRFNPLARNVPDIEHCAAALEAMRIENGRMGQNRDEVIGGYQGSFIWLEREGVFISQSLNGSRFPALVRSGDGRLVIPGAVEQPVILAQLVEVPGIVEDVAVALGRHGEGPAVEHERIVGAHRVAVEHGDVPLARRLPREAESD